MPEYTTASLLLLVSCGLAAWRTGVLAHPEAWLTLIVFGLLTVVFDIVLTGIPIVTYGNGLRSGLAVGPMPIEDLAYGLALCLLALAVWHRTGRRA